MKFPLLKALVYGFILWLVPFGIGMALFPLRTSDRAFFETIMPVTITLLVVVLSYFYFTSRTGDYLKEGLIIGILWLTISIVFDLLMFMWGPMAMTPVDYLEDIGLTYLIYPIVTTGTGYLLKKKTTS